MRRRSLLRAATAAIGLPSGFGGVRSVAGAERATNQRGSFAVDGNRVRFFTEAVEQPVRVLVAADTHLFADDDRGAPFRKFSARMAGAYHVTRHFQTGAETNPEESFVRLLEQAQEKNVDLVALVGDIFSFPSEAAIEWTLEQLEKSKVRYLYVAGNHDWHYEGMPGSLEELRETWIEKRLKPLYQEKNPLMAAYDVGGIRMLSIDNSHYQIVPEQLTFFRSQVKAGKPLVLMLHIPLFAPGRSIGFGCGNPAWGAAAVRNFELERRPRWPASGHTATTTAFHREVFAAPNLLGVFAGHIHEHSVDVVNGIPQFVADDNASGG
ncbi:MAG: metallophosphoesterase, partial [Planctomycetota bacterium]